MLYIYIHTVVSHSKIDMLEQTKNIKPLSIITVCIGLFSLLLGVLFVLNASSENEAIARVCAMEGVNIVVGIFFFMIIAMKAQFKLRIDYCIYALKFNIPLIPHYMSMYILASSDRIMITNLYKQLL